MQLIRCRDQNAKTLDAFYLQLAQGDRQDHREIGAAMLELIARLRALRDERQVYGLTSHHRLCLLATDTWQSPWFVIVSALNKHNYFVEYLLPSASAPWPDARVKGEARSEEDAVEMIVTAMERSRGWLQAEER